MATVLECRQVGKRYGGVQALTDINLVLVGGEIVGLIGPNGAGKTTLIDVITGVEDLSEGSVSIDGKRLSGPPSRRAQFGIARTFQHPQVASDASIAENISLGYTGPHMRSVISTLRTSLVDLVIGRRRWVEQVEKLADVAGLRNTRRSTALAGFPELRATEIARAMANSPRVALLDEPFQGIEDEQVPRIISLMEGFRSAGTSIIVVDHNIDIVSSFADRLILMVRGTIVVDAPPADCLANPLFRAEYLGEA